MIATTRPHTDGPDDRIPTAAPCKRCGREDGFVPHDSNRPWRGRGYCPSCYNHLWQVVKAGRATDFDSANAAKPYTGSYYRSIAVECAHAAAYERARARMAAGFWPNGPYLTDANCRPAHPYPTGGLKQAA